jgi:hypothetical protein
MVCRWIFFNAISTIPKDMAGMTRTLLRSMSYAMIVPSSPAKKNQNPFWANCNHCVLGSPIHATKSNINPSKQDPHTDRMLQCPIISTIVFKDLDWKLAIIGTRNSTYKKVTLSLMHDVSKTTRPIKFPPCVFLHIQSKFHRVLPECPIIYRQPLRNTLGCL